MSAPGDSPAIRASDAEREQTMTVLRDAAGEGRLTFEELADRIEAAGTSTTRIELERLTGDLPVTLDHVSAPSAAGTDLATLGGQSSVFGDVRQAGAWRVPTRSRWTSVFGDVVLDLREAVVADARVEIDASTVFGDVLLLVPEGVSVEVRSKAFFGDVRQKAGQFAPRGAPVVVLTGGTWFGDVRIQARRLRERLSALLLGRQPPAR